MTSALYLLVFIIPIVAIIVLVIVMLYRKKNSHTELYSEGLHNENNGLYDEALHNYEHALIEIKKYKPGNKFHNKITQKIKILRTTIEYEKNFRNGREISIK